MEFDSDKRPVSFQNPDRFIDYTQHTKEVKRDAREAALEGKLGSETPALGGELEMKNFPQNPDTERALDANEEQNTLAE